jgi:hypothetical protein
MYAAFDSFLGTPTWYTNRPVERRRFFEALDAIVRRPDFEAEALADYLIHRADNPRLNHVARQLAAEALSVRDFLIATGGIVPP